MTFPTDVAVHDPGDPSGSPFDRGRRPRLAGLPRGALAGVSLLGLAFSSLMIALVVMAAWPGSFSLFAPLLCSADLPDAFVVVDRYQVRPGETAFNFTMYCVGPTGRIDEIGFFRPMLLLFASVAVILTAFALVATWRVRRATRPASGPFA